MGLGGFTAEPQRTLSKRGENIVSYVKDAANSEVSEKLLTIRQIPSLSSSILKLNGIEATAIRYHSFITINEETAFVKKKILCVSSAFSAALRLFPSRFNFFERFFALRSRGGRDRSLRSRQI